MSLNEVKKALQEHASPRVWRVIVPPEHMEAEDRPYIRLRSLTLDEIDAVRALEDAEQGMLVSIALGIDEIGGNWSYLGLPADLSQHWPRQTEKTLEEIFGGRVDLQKAFIEKRAKALRQIFTLNEISSIYTMQNVYHRGSAEEKKPSPSQPAPSFSQSAKRA